MRRSKPMKIGDLWSGFVASNSMVSRRLCEARIPDAWIIVAGAHIASLTNSVDIKNGILHISMSSSVARQEVFMRREEFKTRLNSELGMVVVNSIIVK